MRATVKQLINRPSDYVSECLSGLAAAHSEIVRVDLERRIVSRQAGPTPGKVALISGGGSGHEPLHAGYVGQGMLDAACIGEIFTSPVPDQILEATRTVEGGAGVLYVVKNYTGDVLNFTLAAERAREAGIPVALVFVDDDVAVEATASAGRRGTAATCIVQKIAGAAAEAGAPLDEVAAVASRVNRGARSFGVALSSCATPSLGRPIFELGPNEIEFGVGIHGERGRRRGAMAPASQIVGEMLEAILSDLRPPPDAALLAFVNGFGGTPLGQQFLVYNELARHLARGGLRATRSLVGSYVTSLDTAGVSITLVLLDEELTRLWDAPALTVGLRKGA